MARLQSQTVHWCPTCVSQRWLHALGWSVTARKLIAKDWVKLWTYPLYINNCLQPTAGSTRAPSAPERCSQRMCWWLGLERDMQDPSCHICGICTQPSSHHVQFSSRDNQGVYLGRVQYGATVGLRVVRKEKHEIFQDASSRTIFSLFYFWAAAWAHEFPPMNKQIVLDTFHNCFWIYPSSILFCTKLLE